MSSILAILFAIDFNRKKNQTLLTDSARGIVLTLDKFNINEPKPELWIMETTPKEQTDPSNLSDLPFETLIWLLESHATQTMCSLPSHELAEHAQKVVLLRCEILKRYNDAQVKIKEISEIIENGTSAISELYKDLAKLVA